MNRDRRRPRVVTSSTMCARRREEGASVPFAKGKGSLAHGLPSPTLLVQGKGKPAQP